MKKRMLLMFAFGMSIGSPVFAAAPGESIIGPNKTGELSISSIDLRGAQCNRHNKKPLAVITAQAERQEEAAGHAGKAAARAN